MTGLVFYCFNFYELKCSCLLYMCVLRTQGTGALEYCMEGNQEVSAGLAFCVEKKKLAASMAIVCC
jgi:hypothetical protein